MLSLWVLFAVFSGAALSSRCTSDSCGAPDGASVFFINMPGRHAERRRRLSDDVLPLHDFSLLPRSPAVEFFDGIDLAAVDNPSGLLASKGVTVLSNWTDPTTDRAMTTGEVGCALSHLLVWQEIVERNLEYAIVFEDDIDIHQDAISRMDNGIRNHLLATDTPYDIIYVGRKPMFDEKLEVRIDEATVEPLFSWWTIGVMLSNRGARRLLTQSFRQNLIVVDEYIPIMTGKHGTTWQRDMFHGNSPERMVRALALSPAAVEPVDNFALQSTTEYGRPFAYEAGKGFYESQGDRFVVVTVASQATEGYMRFARSCAVYGIPYRVLGLGQAWQGPSNLLHGEGGTSKLTLLKDFLFSDEMLTANETSARTIVLFSDSYDAVLTGSPTTILSRFHAAQVDVLFSAERFCWPDASLAHVYPTTDGPYRFLNSGGFIGRVEALRTIFQRYAVQPNEDDQRFYTRAFLSLSGQSPSIALDTHARLFQTLAGSHDDVRLDSDRSRLHNLLTASSPVHVHGNGPVASKVFMNELGRYLAQQFRPVYGWNPINYGVVRADGDGGPRTRAQQASLDERLFRRQRPAASEQESSTVVCELPTVFISVVVDGEGALTNLAQSLGSVMHRLAYARSCVTLYVHFSGVHRTRESLVREYNLEFPTETGLLREYANVTVRTENMSEPAMRDEAIRVWEQETQCSYLFAVDPIVSFTYPFVLPDLIRMNRQVIAPLLRRSPTTFWSNFWGAVDPETGFYARSNDYEAIALHTQKGVFNVPYIYASYLLRRSLPFSFHGLFSHGYHFSQGSDMAFCNNLRNAQIFMHVSSMMQYGSLNDNESVTDEEKPDKAEEFGFGGTSKKYRNRKHSTLYQYFSHRDEWETLYLNRETRLLLNAGKVPLQSEPCRDTYQVEMFSEAFCEHLIEEMEEYGEWSGGERGVDVRLNGGYEEVPTVDIHMRQIGLESVWEDIVTRLIAPIASAYYGNYKTKGTNISFVVKYSMSGQRELEGHHDASAYTVNVALSQPDIDFTGGGVRFTRYDCRVPPLPRGSLLMHPGRMTHHHQGLSITSGSRYILVSFID